MDQFGPLVTQMLVVATVLAVIVLALTNVLSAQFKLKKNTKPLVALVLGVLLGVAAMPLTDMKLAFALWVGGLAGLTASGAYDAAKATLTKKEEKEEE